MPIHTSFRSLVVTLVAIAAVAPAQDGVRDVIPGRDFVERLPAGACLQIDVRMPEAALGVELLEVPQPDLPPALVGWFQHIAGLLG